MKSKSSKKRYSLWSKRRNSNSNPLITLSLQTRFLITTGSKINLWSTIHYSHNLLLTSTWSDPSNKIYRQAASTQWVLRSILWSMKARGSIWIWVRSFRRYRRNQRGFWGILWAPILPSQLAPASTSTPPIILGNYSRILMGNYLCLQATLYSISYLQRSSNNSSPN